MLGDPTGYNCDFCITERAVIVIKGGYDCYECRQEIPYCEECLHKLVNALYDWKVEQDKKKEV